MSIKEIKTAKDEGKIYFGLKQCLKHIKNIKKVYVPKDAGEDILKRLKEKGVDFEFTKSHKDLLKELDNNFHCSVFSITSRKIK